MKKIKNLFKIKTNEELFKYCKQLAEEEAKKAGKDTWDASLEDIYQALSKVRKKIPKRIFQTKISNFIKIKNFFGHTSDGYNTFSFFMSLNPLYIVPLAGKRLFGKLFGKTIKNTAKNAGAIYICSYLAREVYKNKKQQSALNWRHIILKKRKQSKGI